MDLAIALLVDSGVEILATAPFRTRPPPPFLLHTPVEAEISFLQRKKRKRQRHKGFQMVTIPGYNMEEFRQNFRLRRSTFEVMIFLFFYNLINLLN